MEIMKDIEVIRCKGSKICSPFVNKETGAVYYISAGTGEIFEYDNNHGEHKAILFTGGEPLGAQFDSNKTLHIADAAHAAVLRLEESGQPAIMVKSYEEKTFKGPSSIAFGPNGSLYFTDSGPFGETTFEKPHGSIFSIAQNPSGGQILRPLVLDSLAHPCGIATHPSDPKVVYVAELFQNRLLRLVQRPANTHHLSVFYQFNGGMGPSAIALDQNGHLYVALYDFAGLHKSTTGKICEICPQGNLLKTFDVPGTEVTGITFSADYRSLYITEASSNSIFHLILDSYK